MSREGLEKVGRKGREENPLVDQRKKGTLEKGQERNAA